MYWETLQSLHGSIKNKRQELFTSRVWFCSMITHVHTCPESRTWNGQSLTGNSLTIHFTDWTCHSVISMCLVSWKNIRKGSASTWTMNSRTLWMTGSHHGYRNFWNTESFGSLIKGIVVFKCMVHTLSKVFIYTHSVVLYLFIWTPLVVHLKFIKSFF